MIRKEVLFLLFAVGFVVTACDTSGIEPTSTPEGASEATSTNGLTAPDAPSVDIASPVGHWSNGVRTIASYDGTAEITVDVNIGDLKSKSRVATYLCEFGENCPNFDDPDAFFPNVWSGDIDWPYGVWVFTYWFNRPDVSFTWQPTRSTTIWCLPGGLEFPPDTPDDLTPDIYSCPSGGTISSSPEFLDEPEDPTDTVDDPNDDPLAPIKNPDPETKLIPEYGTYRLAVHARNYRDYGYAFTRNTTNRKVKVTVREPGIVFNGPSLVNPGATNHWDATVHLPPGVEVASHEWTVDGYEQTSGTSQSGIVYTLETDFYQPSTVAFEATSTDGITYTASRSVSINDDGCAGEICRFGVDEPTR